MISKKIEQVLEKAREQDHVCEFCYYEAFDDRAYPCSRWNRIFLKGADDEH